MTKPQDKQKDGSRKKNSNTSENKSNSYFETQTSFSGQKVRKDMNMNEIINLAWGAKEILRGDFKRIDYGRIILPFIVLRRLGRVLEPTKEKVLKELDKLKGSDEKLIEARLNQITGYRFHNKSTYDLELLLSDPNSIHKNMKTYMRGFSENVRDIFENFKFNNTIDELHKQDILYQIVQHFAKASLDPKEIDHHLMGTIYEELIRRTSEATNEEAGEHFTPREVIQLMVNLIFSHDEEFLKKKGLSRTVYDPAAGTGGMLAIAYEHILKLNPNVRVDVFGQELLPYAYAICKSDMLLKELDLNNVRYGNSLTDQDQFKDAKFHYMLSNPPFGVDWGKYERQILAEADKGFEGKYGAGLPRKSDGSLLFLLHMISKMKPKIDGGGRIVMVLNGSPLFTGEADSGESNIRKWIIENDMLEAIVALPDQLFYNTGIFTYLWIVTNNKPEKRKGKIQLINASGEQFFKKMKTSLGMKRNFIDEPNEKQITKITKIFEDFKEDEFCKIFDNEDFGYIRITVERPLKRNFQINDERIERLKNENAFQKLPEKKLKSNGPTQNEVLTILMKMPSKLYKNYEEFSKDLKDAFKNADFNLKSPLQKTIESVLSERDEYAEPYFKNKTDEYPVPDSELRDYENIPLKQNIDEYFKNEVKKYVPDAWIDDSTREKTGYEIPFTRHFYIYKPLRPLEEIDSEIKQLQKEISEGLTELMK